MHWNPFDQLETFEYRERNIFPLIITNEIVSRDFLFTLSCIRPYTVYGQDHSVIYNQWKEGEYTTGLSLCHKSEFFFFKIYF